MCAAALLGRFGPPRLACLGRRLALASSPGARAARPRSGSRSGSRSWLSNSAPADREQQKVRVTFVSRDGELIETWGRVGDSILDVVVNRNLDIDGFGACEGTLACSTCHVIFTPATFASLTPPSDEELDMLDLAYALTPTSRLGCQICLSASMDRLRVQIPSDVSDIRQQQN